MWGKKCRYAEKCTQVPKSASACALFAPNRIFDDGNEFHIKNYPQMTPITIHLRKKCRYSWKCAQVPKSAKFLLTFCTQSHFWWWEWIPHKKLSKNEFEEKSVGLHENAHKCLKVLSACALFASYRIFDDGNEFPIKKYPKMTPITINLRKKV